MKNNINGALLLVRIMVGTVFLAEGIQKFLYTEMLGAGRFRNIGIPFPEFSAPFVGVVEILFGLLVIAGLFTRRSVIPLLIDILVAIATTKIPMLMSRGFWPAVHESRVDVTMVLGLLAIYISGGGSWSLDALRSRR